MLIDKLILKTASLDPVVYTPDERELAFSRTKFVGKLQ